MNMPKLEGKHLSLFRLMMRCQPGIAREIQVNLRTWSAWIATVPKRVIGTVGLSSRQKPAVRKALTAAALLAVLLALAAAQPTAAQVQPASPPDPQTVPSAPGATAETLHLLVGRSLVISSPVRIKRVSVADPTILGAVAITPNQLLINAKAAGASSLVIWDETGQSQTFDVFVDLDVTGLNRRLRAALPNEPVQAEATRDVVTLTGQVSSQAVADRIVAIAQDMVPKKEDVVSLLQVPTPPSRGEVLLQVKFLDVDRTALTQLGLNILGLPGAKNIFTTTTGQYSPPTLPPDTPLSASSGGYELSSLLNIFYFRPDINLAATIQALQEKDLLQILAEPNVLSETGKKATFLDGGKFPFPVVQNAVGGLPVVTIQFQQFGVELDFTPVITADGLIHLKVAPSVSSLDFTNALTISGFTIPSLATRSVEAEMVLKDGQPFVIAGLLNNQVTKEFSKVPGIGDIPIIGKLFQSESFEKDRDELLVIVTPHIINLQTAPQPPQFRYPVPFMGPVPAPKSSGGGK
jgi:pilus assembly protein CpaC